MLKMLYVTNLPEAAKIADEAKVDRVVIDLETMGKAQRQKNMDSLKSQHDSSDVAKIKPLLKTSRMHVRVNPVNDNLQYEIDAVIDGGADIIMLPMFKNAKEVDTFIKLVNSRTKVCLLFETHDAVCNINEILNLGGIDEVHIGVNDLVFSEAHMFCKNL